MRCYRHFQVSPFALDPLLVVLVFLVVQLLVVLRDSLVDLKHSSLLIHPKRPSRGACAFVIVRTAPRYFVSSLLLFSPFVSSVSFFSFCFSVFLFFLSCFSCFKKEKQAFPGVLNTPSCSWGATIEYPRISDTISFPLSELQLLNYQIVQVAHWEVPQRLRAA